MTNNYEFGADIELDKVRVSHNLSKVLTGKCGRKKKLKKKGRYSTYEDQVKMFGY